ncbi:unnamed protein product, partial [Brachionus calyciflorus]
MNSGILSIISLKDLRFWLKLTTTGLFGLTALYLGKIWHSYRFFKNLGIKTPPWQFFYGNYLQLTKNKNYSEVLKEWTRVYGKTYGYYQGHYPILVTSDLEFIQEVFVKQSTNFAGRKRIFGTRDDNSPDHMLFTSSRSTWKIMRTLINPTFSSAKLRDLGPLLIKCTDRLNKILDNEQEKELEIGEFFKRFTMDSIWNCAFGVDTDIQNEPENEYNIRSEAIFCFIGNPNPMNFITIYIPEFQNFFLNCFFVSEWLFSRFIDFSRFNPLIWFMNHLFHLIELRKSEKIKKKDYLQILIDAASENGNEKVIDDYTKSRFEKKLSLTGIKLNLTGFLLAGYETTSTALTYASFVLIKYPDEQAKLYDMIKSKFETEHEINSDSVQDIDYLDMFIKEVLRMYPIANPAVDRRCTRATQVKGLKIPEGLVVSVDVLNLHFDADLWGPVDPNEFYPLRHEVKRNPLAYMAFGNGPRYCLGMKFALIEIKIALCKLLFNFELLPTKDFNGQLELIEIIVRRPKSVNVI